MSHCLLPAHFRLGVDQDPNLNDTLSNFQFYASNARDPLRKMKIDFQRMSARSFRDCTGETVRTFRPKKADSDMTYSWGQKPRVENGVMNCPQESDSASPANAP